ncbi:MAG: 7-cyano-7-deazaguanine synthase, partial [Dehalococcoidia bacterium]|nr:7-cyano-7-deazaguanine synthase [Dehalococcoidia bacterium]
MTKSMIAVALSGGVDSAVAASLLKDAGHEVEGIHMQLWDSPTSQYQQRQAEALCSRLGIPFHSVDLRREFDRRVVEYFCQEYQRGRTPNPCVTCNRHIKFGILLDRVLSTGADYLATGHYARVEPSNDGYRLLKAIDTSKDQSYFLYTLRQRELQ